MSKMLMLKEVADYCGVHPATVKRWVKSGKLPAFRVGRSLKVNSDDLHKHINQGAAIKPEEMPEYRPYLGQPKNFLAKENQS